MLEFHDDAIILSGETGTKLKSEIIKKYYPLWWNITSGGDNRSHSILTSIIELNAGTGENYIPDKNQIILGSAGHALDLKAIRQNTDKLRIILVEDNQECFLHLQNVIKKNWSNLKYSSSNKTDNDDVFIFNNTQNALNFLTTIDLGLSLFFFDQLLYTSWEQLNFIAQESIKKYYQTGTEFIVFLFTSDWFQGRDDLVPLPTDTDKKDWSSEEHETVRKTNDLFGHKNWQDSLLNSKNIIEKIQIMVSLYRIRLHAWFRYVLPLPFEPKTDQTFHLFMCSNYEQGINLPKGFFIGRTNNSNYSPNNKVAYQNFTHFHPEKIIKGSARSDEWKILWDIIKNHDEGLCDELSTNLQTLQHTQSLKQSLEWLSSNGYIKKIAQMTDKWTDLPVSYRLNWDILEEKLKISRPQELMPLSSDSSWPKQPKKKNPTLLDWT